MAAASTPTAMREGDEIADRDDGDLRLVKKRAATRAKLDPDLWSRLNDSLTEKIIARLPFKALYRAATLSNTWSLAFRAPSFQREVLHSSCPGWPSYSPLFFNDQAQILGFDGKSQLWHRLPTPDGGDSGGRSWRLESSGGSLLCWTSRYTGPDGNPRDNIHALNPLNESWKQLPPAPKIKDCFPPIFHVVCERSDAYQVISLQVKNARERVDRNLRNGSIYIRIFDSSSESWVVTSHGSNGCQMDWAGSVFLNGVIYMLVDRGCNGYNLVSFNVRDRSWEFISFIGEDAEDRSAQSRIIFPMALELNCATYSQLVVCGSDIWLVAHYYDCFAEAGEDEVIALFKVDAEQGMAFHTTTAPREMLTLGPVHGAVGYGDCVYIFGRYPSSSPIRYNVNTREWGWASVDILSPDPEADKPTVGDEPRRLRCGSLVRKVSHFDKTYGWIQSKYEPSWNPFLEV